MAKLVVNPTSNQRKEIPLPRAPLCIGRDPSNDLVLADAMVSRRHAVIEYRGDRWYLRDCNSSNGSLVNGDRIAERGLRDGDLVAIGTARLMFRDEVPADASSKVVQHPSSARLKCPDCGAGQRPGDSFCRGCGNKLAPAPIQPRMLCPSCGSVIPLPARFCNSCGTGLAPAEPEAERGREVPPPARPVVVPAPPPWLPSAPPFSGPPAAAVPLRPLPFPAASPAAPSRLRLAPSAATGSSAQRELEPAGPWRRSGAALFDWTLVGGSQVLLLSPVLHYWWTRPEARSVSEVTFLPIFASIGLAPLALALASLYFVYFWGVRGATPGQELMGIEVVDESGARPIGIPQAFIRLLGYVLSFALLGAGFLIVAFGDRALHDRIAGTRVVLRRRAGA